MANTQNQIDFNKITADVISKNLDKIILGTYKIGSSQWKNLRLKTGDAFTNYLTSAIEKYSKVKTLLYRDKPMPIYDFYVDIDLINYDQTISTQDINNLLNLDKNVAIFGGGGSGKSTLFKHLFLNTITETEYIPIFIELRSLNDIEQSLVDCMYNTISTLNFNLEKEYFEKSLINGRYLIFLDGFDEVDDSIRKRVTQDIISLTDKYKSNHYILSSRRSDVLFNGWNNFTELEMSPLSKNQALELINNMRYDNEVKGMFLHELEHKLYDTNKSFCSNPLLLNIMLLTFREFAEIPDKIHIFYRRAFDVLYSQHDATKGYKRKKRAEKDLTSDEFKKVLATMSTLSYLDDVNSFDNSTLLNYIKDAKTILDINFSEEEYKVDLVESVCILILDGLDYKFQHRTFQEYFTAEYILSMDDEDLFQILRRLIKEKPSSLRSDVVFHLMYEMEKGKLEKAFIIPFLKEIISFTESPTKEASYLKYLRSGYTEIGINYSMMGEEDINTEEDAISFTVRNDRMGYTDFIENFISQKYKGSFNFEEDNIGLSKTNDMSNLKKYGKEEENSPDISVKLDENVTDNEALFNEILGHSYYYLIGYEFSIKLLKELEEKHKKQGAIRDVLFKLK
ncbi:NACHT domain-containing protein [Peribacillus butanolivorans]|uniref:NACHT domain-containing protein n=1 Tax=Peribacillus butanolivorans TaxID=421767 RepID=UPI00207C63EE|nr:NACHT domain-containing protein [Peribacillus butanolivorans]MCO0600726.1 NACHT domain-containing protein [Peribacillus butanolivorans]